MMAETHVISALTNKRAEVLGEIKHYEKLIKEFKLNLQSLDKTIHLFDDSYDLRTIKPKKVHNQRYFKTGEAKILILDTLRVASAPLSTSEIAIKIALIKKIDSEEDFNLEHFSKVLLSSLNRCESNNLIKRVGKDGLTILWQIRRD
jgi:hypothetical protein